MSYSIQPVDKVSITVLVDNYTDLLRADNGSVVHRPILSDGKTLLAEHGLSLFIQVKAAGKSHTVLMDTGASASVLEKNAEILNVDLNDIEEIIISHGHYDHTGSLLHVLHLSSCRIPVNMHPASFNNRRKRQPDGSYTNLPVVKRDEITHSGAILSLSAEPSFVCNKHMLLTGEIERTNTFEHGSPILEVQEQGIFIIDPFRDDQSLIFHLKNRGLIIISGCAHAGIINSVRYAQKITGIEKVHAIMGGFHLSGSSFDTIISPTICAMKEIQPGYIIPMHCSGWDAQYSFAREMPDQFLLSTVGTRFDFQA